MQATLTIEYDEKQIAAAITEAVSPDNFELPVGLTVETVQRGTQVITEIELEGKLATFIATIDDLLSCVSIAEKTLCIIKRK